MFTNDEIRGIATAKALSGGSFIISDDLESISAERIRIALQLLPPAAEAAVALDLLDRDMPELFRMQLQSHYSTQVLLFADPGTTELSPGHGVDTGEFGGTGTGTGTGYSKSPPSYPYPTPYSFPSPAPGSYFDFAAANANPSTSSNNVNAANPIYSPYGASKSVAANPRSQLQSQSQSHRRSFSTSLLPTALGLSDAATQNHRHNNMSATDSPSSIEHDGQRDRDSDRDKRIKSDDKSTRSVFPFNTLSINTKEIGDNSGKDVSVGAASSNKQAIRAFPGLHSNRTSPIDSIVRKHSQEKGLIYKVRALR